MRYFLVLTLLFYFNYINAFTIPQERHKLILRKTQWPRTYRIPNASQVYLSRSLKTLGFEIYQFNSENEVKNFIEYNHLTNADYIVNIKLEDRGLWKSEPNDPSLHLQWYLRKISSLKLREEYDKLQHRSTNNYTIAVIDNGLQTSHEDLKLTIWTNQGEINGDGIDNDNNGYIDDFYGYSATDNQLIPIDRDDPHGTPASGIAAAHINNKKGIASPVNRTNLLFCAKGEGLVSDILECYEYIATQKKLYLDSKGQKGVNIISINLSLGIRFANPKHYPLFCNMYDKLGQLGILSVCVAPNAYINVDEEGDVPSGCESDFIITETFTDQNDIKDYSSGFGKKSIDLGVPGKDMYTTFPNFNSAYSYFTGNSAAGPLLTGSIAQLYEMPCFNLDSFSLQYPAQTALMVKDAILNNTDRVESLKQYTKTGGRLNVYKAFHSLKSRLCDRIVESDQIKIYAITGGQIKIEGLNEFNQGGALHISISNELGQILYSQVKKYPSFAPILIRDQILNTGIYFILFENDKSRIVKKFFATSY